MDYISAFLGEIIQDPGAFQWVLTILVAMVIFTFALGVMFFVAGAADPARRRLQALAGAGEAGATHSGRGERLANKLKKVSPYVLPKQEEEVSKIRQKLQQAGFRTENAVLFFFSFKALFAVILPGAVFAGAHFFFPDAVMKKVVYLGMVAAVVGLFAPNFILSYLATRRQEAIARGFPDSLDLLVVCIEAGLGFDIAMQRIADDMYKSHPKLAEELHVVSAEIRGGIDRIKALKNFAMRTGLPEISGFVALLAQSIKLGTSIAETLRIYSEDFRDKRMQKAEEKAAKLPTKLIFPLLFCFFPVLFIVIIGPVYIRAVEILTSR